MTNNGMTVTERDGKVDLSDIVFTVDGEIVTAAQVFAAFKNARNEIARLQIERDCAISALQLAPQAPPVWTMLCPEWIEAYREWWVRRLMTDEQRAQIDSVIKGG